MADEEHPPYGFANHYGQKIKIFIIFDSPIIEVDLEDTCTRCVNIQVNLDFHSLIRIFAV